MDFYNNLSKFERRITNSVQVGNTFIGSNYPVRIQSMTTTNTLDTENSVQQCIRIFEAGADLVRLTAQGIKEAENLAIIRKKLIEHGFTAPIVADIHFNPNAAEAATYNVEKVRINPGNFVDKRASFVEDNLTDEQYATELATLRKKFTALLQACKDNCTALRIGVNHGSLSDRIMNRYGDTPAGMVESAMEFLRICVDEDFYNVVLSMKASNVMVMVHAYRLLVKQMNEEGMKFPLHLGVTEAGEGEDGRIKSAVGIGALLADGIGDTIRVSLTEEPEAEIPIAKTLANYFTERIDHKPIADTNTKFYSPYSYVKATSNSVLNIGGNNAPIVIADLSYCAEINNRVIESLGFSIDEKKNCWMKISDTAPDYIYLGKSPCKLSTTADLPIINRNFLPISSFSHSLSTSEPNFVRLNSSADISNVCEWFKSNPQSVILLYTSNTNGFGEQRSAILNLKAHGVTNPIVIERSYSDNDLTNIQLKAAADCGPLFIDGLADGIMISANIPVKDIISTAFTILQAARARISKTEFISCPGCGRTLFNLQQTASQIRERTKHLTSLKIGIMGCIVNGPGEMADADYGYVGASPKKVTLYKGKVAIKKNIPQENAIDELIMLIKESGDWKD